MTIQEIFISYRSKINTFDLELLLANSLAKTREFVLSHPEYELTSHQSSVISKLISRRIKGEPVAYLTGHKEFYGLDFVVNKHTLVPRPETELMVEKVLNESSIINHESCTIIDVGTGSGCVIISIAKNIPANYELSAINFFATDISKEALKVAKKNTSIHDLDKKIKFLHGNILDPFLKTLGTKKMLSKKLVITANLPYLSEEIYNSAPIDVKNFEPKSALYSPEAGLQHYRKLLEQLKSSAFVLQSSITCFLEISPEQKQPIIKIIKSFFPKANIAFTKDLAGKWRICKIVL